MIVEIRAVEIGTAGEATSAPRVIRAAAADSRLSYDVLWKPVLPGMTARVGEVRVSTPEGCHQVTVVAVAKAGIARPAHPSDGEEVARQHVIVSADKQAVFPLNVSRKIRKPYWLCCFLADGSPGVLIDPPIKNMKVG